MRKYAYILALVVCYSAVLGQSTNQRQSGKSKMAEQGNAIQYKDIVKRLTDLKTLASMPVPGEKSAMWASYDRRSKVDASTGAFIDWAANNDGLDPQFIRKEGENMVLAEMEGPGAIVRVWSASPEKGHIKIFVDGNLVPVIDLPFIDFFNPASIPAFNYPELVYETAARGYNNYVPITYQRSCKVVAEQGWGQYYQFNYISFPAGTSIGAFDAKPTYENSLALQSVNDFFSSKLGDLPYNVKDIEEKKLKYTIAPGASEKITITGSKAIYALKASLKIDDSLRIDQILRKLILQIHWDGEKDPSVWSPIGDFFGSAPGYNLYRTLPMGMTEEGMYSYWYMPFIKSATITLTNHFDNPVSINLSIGVEALTENAKNYSRFHAKWHRNLPPLSDPARWPDWTVLETKGKGRFLGMSLLVWNPKGGSCKQYGGEGQHWWGEGDEKFFVDDEIFPSTFGTGTEDYFGYAWCIPECFSKAFHSQNYTEDNMGFQSMNRWQIIDNVPFQKSFKGYLEKYFPDHWPTQYAVVPYWYLDADGDDPIKATHVDELYGFEIPYQVYREPGVIEGEHLKIIKNTGGYASNDVFVDERLFDRVSGHKVFTWIGDPGASNELQTKFLIEKAGTYKIMAKIVKSPDGGRFQFSINNNPVEQFIDMQEDSTPGSVDTVALGSFQLVKGENELIMNWLDVAGFGNRIMLDYISLKEEL